MTEASDLPEDSPNEETENPGAPSRPSASDSSTELATDGTYQTLAQGYLSPRHRRLAQLAAQGLSNKELAQQLDYAESRISVLLRHPLVVEEIRRLQDQIFSETIEKRLKGMSDLALTALETALRDRSGKTKISEKLETAKFIIEKVDGKAMQKVDVGSSAIGSFLDRLDALKAAGRQLEPERTALPAPASDGIIDVTPGPVSTDEDDLSDWVTSFADNQRK
jgi:hypothetical protein